MAIQKNVLILIGILSLAYILIFLLSPKDITDYTIADTEYWRETNNRLLLKTSYDYNNNESVRSFPKIIGDWKSFDFRYPDAVYTKLNADILLSRAYTKGKGYLVWMDIINSKTGESFHKQKICVEGAGWTIDSETIAEFKIAEPPNPFTKLYANRLDVSKVDKKTGKETKQVMTYWFMFKKFGSNDSVTMIRLSAPVKNSTEETFNIMKDFVEGQLFDAMYKRVDKESITMAESIVNEYGNKGIFAIIAIVLIPIGITIVGIRKKD